MADEAPPILLKNDNGAVYTAPDPAKLVIDPFVGVMSPTANVVLACERVKVTVAAAL